MVYFTLSNFFYQKIALKVKAFSVFSAVLNNQFYTYYYISQVQSL